VGAFLRLWQLNVAGFLDDQAGYFTLARDSILQGKLPLTGIAFSNSAMSPPIVVYLIMPFTALGKNPFPVVVSVALLNLVGVALCYLWALRAFGRLLAAVGALLFATCETAVEYGRFFWNMNYLAPLLALWAITLFAGGARGKRGWFVPNVFLLTVIVLIHPTGLLLAPAVLVAIVLAPQTVRWWEYVLGATLSAMLLVPTIVWELMSKGSDLGVFLQVGSHPASLDLRVFYVLYQILGGTTYAGPGADPPFAPVDPTTLYARLRLLHRAIELGVVLLFAAGYLNLTRLVAAPARDLWRRQETRAAGWRGLQGLAGTSFRGLRADPVWRGYLLLWLWVTLPPLVILRHSSPLHKHYLFILYPAAFVVCGLAVSWLAQWSRTLPDATAIMAARWSRRWQPRRAAQASLAALVAVLITGQAALSLLHITAVAQGQFDAADRYLSASYGYPLGEVQRADALLRRLEHQQGAVATLISLPVARYRGALNYLLVREERTRMDFPGDCLVLPAADMSPALVVTTSAAGYAAALLPALPTASHLTDIAMPGGSPFAVYRLHGALPALPDETPLAPTLFRDSQGTGLRLEAAARTAAGGLRLRWRVLASTGAGQPAQLYQVQARTLTPTGRAGAVLAAGGCAPTRWQTGETVFTWLTPPPGAAGAPPRDDALAGGPLTIEVMSHTQTLWSQTLGPLRLLSGVYTATAPTRLAPAGGAASRLPGSITPQGLFTLAPAALGPP
jgi:hypothetical protein